MSIKTFSQRFVPEDTTEKESVPERNLLAACLERAIRDILNKPQSEGGTGETTNRHCREACTWLRSQERSNFSFRWICHHLDLDPKAIRRWIYEAQVKGVKFDCGTTMF